jgi:hypothetical protein
MPLEPVPHTGPTRGASEPQALPARAENSDRNLDEDEPAESSTTANGEIPELPAEESTDAAPVENVEDGASEAEAEAEAEE